MADELKAVVLDNAEKAYAAATEVVATKAAAPVSTSTPVKAPEPAVIIPALTAKAPAKAATVSSPAPVVATVPVVTAVPAAKKAPATKKAVAKPAAAKVAAVAVNQKAAKAKPAKIKTAKVKTDKTKPAAAKPAANKLTPVISKSKDTIMATAKNKTADFTAKAKEAFADVQTKAKTAYAKGTAAVAEAGEFTKGNMEAVVASGKIMAEGVKSMGADYVAEGKKAYATMTADVKEIAAVKSPTDFFQLQAKLLRRNLDSVVALTSKNTEAAVKLAGDVFAPIQGRVSLAVEKVKKAA